MAPATRRLLSTRLLLGLAAACLMAGKLFVPLALVLAAEKTAGDDADAVKSAAEHKRVEQEERRLPTKDEPDDWAQELAKGQQAKDQAPLTKFLDAWHSASHPVSSDVLRKKPDFERAAYALYPTFFVPKASKKEAKYVIIQESFEVHLVEGDLTDDYHRECNDYEEHARYRAAISRFTIKDFRPTVSMDGKKVLYFDRNRIEELARFLAGKHDSSLDNSYEEEPNGQDAELERPGPFTERLGYVNRLLGVIRGHWGKGWHFETQPLVYFLILDKDIKTAVIYDRNGYGGGIALLKRDGKGWRVVDRRGTWIE